MCNRPVCVARAVVILVFMGLLSAAAQGAEPVVLKLRPVAGETQKLKAIVEQKVTQTAGGNPQTVTQTIGLGYTFATQSVADDGTATVKVTYDSVSFKQQGPVESLEYNSEKPTGQVHPMARGFAALVGQSFTMKVTPWGKITQIQGLDAMLEGILRKLEIPEGPDKAMIEANVRKEFGEDALKDNMESMLAVYPDKPVAPGESWTRKVAISKGVPMVMENTFTLKDVGPEIVTLEIRSKLSTGADAPPIDLGNRKLTYNLSGEQTGTIKLSAKTGWMRSADMTQKVGGEMITDAGAGRIVKTPMTIEVKVTMEAK